MVPRSSRVLFVAADDPDTRERELIYRGSPNPDVTLRDVSSSLLPSIVNFPDCTPRFSSSRLLSLSFSLPRLYALFLSACFSFPIRLSATSSRFLSSVPLALPLPLSLSLSLSLGGAGSFLGTAPLLPSDVTAPTDSGCSLAGTLVHSGGQRSDGGRRKAETPESRPVSWLPGGSRLHRSCAGAAILHSFGSMTVVHELSRVSWLRAASSPAGRPLLPTRRSSDALATTVVLSMSFPPSLHALSRHSLSALRVCARARAHPILRCVLLSITRSSSILLLSEPDRKHRARSVTAVAFSRMQ